VRFISAGGDLVLTVEPGDAGPMTAALIAEAQHSTTFAKQVTAAATEVVRSKIQAGLLSCNPQP
jgi:beta-N-acetylhexosaminidase